MPFLPISAQDIKDRNWDGVDFVIVTGDAYVDHPSFGTAIISRVLEDHGYKVGIVSQPKFGGVKDFQIFGRPRLAFMVNSGNIDSMVAHYTAALKKRSDDAFSPGGRAGKRPDRAVTVYCRLIREAYGDVPIIIGGLEASLRRFAHYDYWSDSVMPSILIDSTADLLSFGMGEKQTVEIADRLNNGEAIGDLTDIKGTCYLSDSIDNIEGVVLASYEEVKGSKRAYAEACRIQYDEQDDVIGRVLIQPHLKKYVVQNKPMPPLTTEELDHVYSLPYERYYHPSYERLGGVPGIKEVEFSVTHNRGCFGACNFCSIAYHQGRRVAVRSEKSVLQEVETLVKNPHFKGYIHDVGGPTANFRIPSCAKQEKYGMCRAKKCLAPTPCKKLQVDHSEYLEILKKIRAVKGVKRVFIRSGIRFDYLMQDKSDLFFKELVKHYVSGQLKVAPEHCSSAVLDKMGKPHIEAYKAFADRFYRYTKSINKEQYLVPYLMSSHPGSTMKDAVKLAEFLKKEKLHPRQVQDFYPTPGTISTCMYYTGLDPHTMEKVYVPRTMQEKSLQRALLQFFKPENRQQVIAALKKAGREDLIGNGKNCLITGASTGAEKGKKTVRAKGRWDSKQIGRRRG